MRRLAVYDMDKTITARPTWTPFLLHWTRVNAPGRLVLAPVVMLLGLAYTLRLIDRGTLKQGAQRLMLGRRVTPAKVARGSGSFTERLLRRGVLAGARARIEADRAEGYELVLATASYRFYVADIARRLGFDHVIATDSVYAADGRLEARIAGENCYGAGKLRMIEAWMTREGLARDDVRVRFYSDHVSDAPVFAWADEPFAVNAHAPLRLLAKAQGWPLLEWRS